MRHSKSSLKLRMAIDAITRLVMVTDDWPFYNVYSDLEAHDPETDSGILFALLEEARDVWKPIQDTARMARDEEDTLPGLPLEK